jgi:hypothetical protein
MITEIRLLDPVIPVVRVLYIHRTDALRIPCSDVRGQASYMYIIHFQLREKASIFRQTVQLKLRAPFALGPGVDFFFSVKIA